MSDVGTDSCAGRYLFNNKQQINETPPPKWLSALDALVALVAPARSEGRTVGYGVAFGDVGRVSVAIAKARCPRFAY